jgi:hypothetical protein
MEVSRDSQEKYVKAVKENVIAKKEFTRSSEEFKKISESTQDSMNGMKAATIDLS